MTDETTDAETEAADDAERRDRGRAAPSPAAASEPCRSGSARTSSATSSPLVDPDRGRARHRDLRAQHLARLPVVARPHPGRRRLDHHWSSILIGATILSNSSRLRSHVDRR